MGSIADTAVETALEAIPTVDISDYLSPTASEKAKRNVIEAVSDACSTYGFFNLIGHGVPKEAQQKILDANRMFFKLPEEKKMEVWIGKSVGRSFRGYEPSGIQIHHEGLMPDIKETFMVGCEVPEDDEDYGSFSMGPNLWPTSLPGEEFKNPIMDYQSKMVELAKVLLKILAQGLPKEWNCPPDCLDHLAVKPSIPMRLLHYAPQAVRHEKQFGVADHTDFGCVSILLQEPGTVGLEVYHPPTGNWISVPVKENGYVINMGDMMQEITSGFYRSARHRVVTSSDRERYSVAFFLNGNLKVNAKALDGSGKETIVGEHIRQRLIETMGTTGDKLQ